MATGPRPRQVLEAVGAEPFVTGQQPSADAIQRVAFAAPIPERVVLHPAPYFVEGGVGEPDHVEVIHDELRVGHLVGQRGRVGLVGVDHRVADTSAPPGVLRGEPVLHRDGGTGRDHIDELAPIEIHDAGHQQRRMRCRCGEP